MSTSYVNISFSVFGSYHPPLIDWKRDCCTTLYYWLCDLIYLCIDWLIDNLVDTFITSSIMFKSLLKTENQVKVSEGESC